jgi:hypothetical protein
MIFGVVLDTTIRPKLIADNTKANLPRLPNLCIFEGAVKKKEDDEADDEGFVDDKGLLITKWGLLMTKRTKTAFLVQIQEAGMLRPMMITVILLYITPFESMLHPVGQTRLKLTVISPSQIRK